MCWNFFTHFSIQEQRRMKFYAIKSYNLDAVIHCFLLILLKLSHIMIWAHKISIRQYKRTKNSLLLIEFYILFEVKTD